MRLDLRLRLASAEGVTTTSSQSIEIGVVVIGRNEGERLVRCLQSVRSEQTLIVYVDSGSTDSSVENAIRLGASIVNLTTDIPFTAARARNAGFERLLSIQPDIKYVQFVDGDCEIAPGWTAAAVRFLGQHEQHAIVCGRRKEYFPDSSIYNRLCDIEWDTPIGDTEACGGDFLARSDAYRSVGGFNGKLIAGEEPELCYRLSRAGWRIRRLDHDMTLHDAAITSFRQWRLRSVRSGYAYAARSFLHCRNLDGYCLRENLRIFFWAMAFPVLTILLTVFVWKWFALMLLAYPIQYLRIYEAGRRRGLGAFAATFATFTLMSKWTEFAGQMMFVRKSLTRGQQRIIEYK